jgi:hypothetical protein
MAKPAAPSKSVGAKAANKAKPKPASRSGAGVLGFILSGGALLFLAAVALPACILLVVGMIPTIVAYVVDRTPRRTLTLTVGPLNLAGTVPYCIQLWFGGDTMHGLISSLTSVWVWLVMYLAAAIGWLLHFGMPVIVRFLLEQSIDRRKTRLVQIQKKLRAEWGDEVAGAVGSARPEA